MNTIMTIAVVYVAAGMSLGLVLACATAMGGRADRELEVASPVPVLRLVPDAMSEARPPIGYLGARTGVCPDCLMLVDAVPTYERCPVCDVRLTFPPHVVAGPLGSDLHAVTTAS
jgi:hypothetical protein